MDYPLTKKVTTAWQKVRDTNSTMNVGLLFDRYLPRWDKVKDDKNEAIKQFPAYAKRADPVLLKAWNQRWDEIAKAVNASVMNLSTDWRFITGLGAKGPLEIGFSFHRYGFPYLAGSGLKGIARARGLLDIAELRGTVLLDKLDDILALDKSSDFEKAFQDKETASKTSIQSTLPLTDTALEQANLFRTVFGTSGADGSSGGAIFLDAIPPEVPVLNADIMNPHFPNYYSEPTKYAPTDSQNPIPVLFLTVAPDQPFRFAVGWRGTSNVKAQQAAQNWLKSGLMELGAGAKTSAGYGYFKEKIANTSEYDLPQSATVVVEDIQRDLQGILVEINTNRRWLDVIEINSNRKYRAATNEVTGPTPAKKSKVLFDLKNGQMVNIRKK